VQPMGCRLKPTDTG